MAKHALDIITLALSLGVTVSCYVCRSQSAIPYQAAALAVAVMICGYQHGQERQQWRRK